MNALAAVGASYSITMIFMAVAAGLIFSSPVLVFLETPANIIKDSALFLNVYIGGLLWLKTIECGRRKLLWLPKLCFFMQT